MAGQKKSTPSRRLMAAQDAVSMFDALASIVFGPVAD
jgi:hypothetical protein